MNMCNFDSPYCFFFLEFKIACMSATTVGELLLMSKATSDKFSKNLPCCSVVHVVTASLPFLVHLILSFSLANLAGQSANVTSVTIFFQRVPAPNSFHGIQLVRLQRTGRAGEQSPCSRTPAVWSSLL